MDTKKHDLPRRNDKSPKEPARGTSKKKENTKGKFFYQKKRNVFGETPGDIVEPVETQGIFTYHFTNEFT